ncbi:MAG: hypothetical protein AB7F32_08015 [Victivallaceae bacterium]
MNGYRYILRYYIDPGFADGDRIAELLDFCRCGGVGEVMFFHNPEELFRGYTDRAYDDAWFELAKRLKTALSEAGIAMSLNPWVTTCHLSRGRHFGETGRDFAPMVGETGAVSPITACPLDPAWQRDLERRFAEMAARLGPVTIWVEDDWRLHNHEPSMKYGGCFCPLHLARFAAMAGEKEVGREELLANILKPGKPHPWRALWLDLCRQTLLEPAESLRRAVEAASPESRLALMSSRPDVHAAEGRDWGKLQQALAGDDVLQARPHLPPYTEIRPMRTPPVETRLTIANYRRPVEIYPELENSPRCGRYSKSAAFSAWEILHSVLYGSRGITINHFDMMGNGIALDRHFGTMLASLKPRLDAIAALELDDDRAEGVEILFKPELSRTLETVTGAEYRELCGQTSPLGEMFCTLGFSTRFVTRAPGGSCVALTGEIARALDDAEVETLLKGVLFLDAGAAEILAERGFGDRLGFGGTKYLGLDEAGFAYEEIASDDVALYGLARPRMSAQRCAWRILAMTPLPGADVLSTIRRFDHAELAPGLLRFRNASGGTVLTMAYPLDEHQFFMGFFNNFRRILLQQTIREALSRQTKWAMTTGDDILHVYRIGCRQGTLIGLVNPMLDPAGHPRFAAPGLGAKALRLDRDGTWRTINPIRDAAGEYLLAVPIAPLEAEFLLFGEDNE